MTRLGLVVHPSRAIDGPLGTLRRWAEEHGVELVQVQAPCQQQDVAEGGDAAECDMIVSIGGDGTMLAALRTGARVKRPVLGVACGSLGVLTSVVPDAILDALNRIGSGDWTGHPLPALRIAGAAEEHEFALNDIAVVRSAPGQLAIRAFVDSVLYARFAGDGAIVSAPIGSSAYSLAAGGPLLAPDTAAFLLTPLSAHAGSCPPLVIGQGSELELEVEAGRRGARLEVDGQTADAEPQRLTITLAPDKATVVTFADQEPVLAGLRRRRVITDSPRILAREDREG